MGFANGMHRLFQRKTDAYGSLQGSQQPFFLMYWFSWFLAYRLFGERVMCPVQYVGC